jgi:hypothetical protein
MADGDYDDERSIFSEEEIENELDPLVSDPDIQPGTSVTPVKENLSYDSEDAIPSGNTAVPNQMHDPSPAAETGESSLLPKAPIPASVNAVPSVVLRGRSSTADTA